MAFLGRGKWETDQHMEDNYTKATSGIWYIIGGEKEDIRRNATGLKTYEPQLDALFY